LKTVLRVDQKPQEDGGGHTSFDDFIAKWTDRPVDFDGVYPNQCMDLMHEYVYDVLNLTDKAILAAPAAKDVYINFAAVGGHEHFEQIDNTPTGVPNKGDIVFFGTKVGQYGHVCIFVEGDSKKFTSFDANWPGGSLPHLQSHIYSGCLGWLRPRNPSSTADDALKRADAFIAVCTTLDKPVDKDIVIADIKRLLELEQKLVERDKELDEKNRRLDILGKQVDALIATNEELGRQVDTNSNALKDAKGEIDQLKTVKPISAYSRLDLFIRALTGR